MDIHGNIWINYINQMNEISEQQSWIVQAMSGGRDWHVFFEALETMEGQVGGLLVQT